MTAKATRKIVGKIVLMISGNIHTKTQVPNTFRKRLVDS